MPVVKVTMPDPARSNDPEPKHALVLEKGRANSTLVPLSDDLRTKLNGCPSAFFKAERVMSFEIGDEVPDPHWERDQAKLGGVRRG